MSRPRPSELLCTGCETFKPANETNFARDKAAPLGLSMRCRECRRKADRDREKRIYSGRNKKKLSKLRRVKRRFEQNRKKRISALPNTLTGEQWRLTLQFFDRRCAYCEKALDRENITKDHVIPIAHPDCPGNTAGNVVPACRACNASKKDFLLAEWPGVSRLTKMRVQWWCDRASGAIPDASSFVAVSSPLFRVAERENFRVQMAIAMGLPIKFLSPMSLDAMWVITTLNERKALDVHPETAMVSG